MISKTLGSFECTALLGKGGMGEVYRAKDQKLGRDVAIKVLPEEFAKDADRVARFQREAKLLASLNHPNIAAIYGLEESEGTHFLVLELIEGDTLADRLKRGAIPVEESLKLALQIAEALEAAHEKGVIHRDLKPSNIKVTPEGKVKVLDFGLAKAFAGDQEGMDLSNSPTLSAAATQQGIILGTAAYMSPEQASGESTDKRADIWAFGVVLFEMLTGRSLFAGDNVSQTLARVLERQPDFSYLPSNLHPRIRLLIDRCLEKKARDRCHDIADVRVDIQKVLADPSGALVQPVTTAKPRKKIRLGLSWVAAIAILCIIVAGLAVWYLKPSEPRQIMRFDYELPEGQQFNWNQWGDVPLAVSPNGYDFVYGTPGGLYMRSMQELDARLIPGTDRNSRAPFFSPDGNWLGYLSAAQNKLKKVAISGGAPVALCDTQSLHGPSWNADNTIIYGTSDKGILQVSADGGLPKTLIEAKDGINFAPQLLPDGRSVLFGYWSGGTTKIMVQSLESGEAKELFEGDSPRYLPTGHLVYILENNLLAVPFDTATNEVKGGPVSIVEGVGSNYCISDEGTLLFIPGTAGTTGPEFTFVWVDRKGNEEPLGAPPDNYNDYYKISPDGTRVALSITTDGNQDIWIWDLFRKTMMRLTFDDSTDLVPVWTPDSQRVVFSSYREGRSGIFWKLADGSGKVEQLALVPDINIWPYPLSLDGKNLFFTSDGKEIVDIGMIPMEGNRTPKFLLQEKYYEDNPQISPDGRWLAYASDESGQLEIYVRSFPDVDSGGRWQISTSGGDSPIWSPSGKELFYRTHEAIMTVSVETDPAFKLGTPKVLFPNRYVGEFDIDPGGKRFLMLKPPQRTDDEAQGPNKINIFLNWFEELKERVPTD